MPNISLTKHQEQFIRKKVASGQYLSASEIVREGLRLLEETERDREMRRAQLREAVVLGARDIQEGKTVPAQTAFRAARKRANKRTVPHN